MPQAVKNIQTIVVPCDISLATIEAFEQDLQEIAEGKPEIVRLDCEALVRVLSSHINVIWNAHSLCRSLGIVARLANPTPALMRILHVLDLVGSFKYDGANHVMGQRQDQDVSLIDLPQAFSDAVHPTSDDIDEAIARFVAFLTDARVSATTILELRTLYYEIATNIRLHSGISRQEEFQVKAGAKWDQLTITFTDSGKFFDTSANKAPVDFATASQQQKRRGFGLPMIQRLADELKYNRDESGHNVLTIVKKWHR